jgi:HAMP domain-containing protein
MMGNLSIRLRLTTWYGGVLASVLIAFGAVIYFTMRHQMLSRLDHGLREEMADVLSEIQRAKDRDSMLEWLDRRFGQHQGFDFQITTTDGGRVFVNDRLGDVQLPIPSPLMVDRDVFATHQRTAVPRRRIVTRKLQGPETTLIVQVARSLDFYDHEMSQLFLTHLLTGPLTLLIAIGGGYFLAWRALWPVERMAETANRIEARQLSQRIDIANANDELGRLATTLNGMLDRLEKSFREMQRFTADVSHERAIRTSTSVCRATLTNVSTSPTCITK